MPKINLGEISLGKGSEPRDLFIQQFEVVPCLSLAGLDQPERPLSITSYQTAFLLFETIGLLNLASVLSDIVRHVSICSHPIAFKDV